MAKKTVGLCRLYERTRDFRDLKKEMVDDLTARGLISKPYMDKVEEYMSLWCLSRMLEEDIAARGVYIEYQNGANQKGTTDNKSVEKLVRVSAQKLSIWTALGFKEQAANSKPADAARIVLQTMAANTCIGPMRYAKTILFAWLLH